MGPYCFVIPSEVEESAKTTIAEGIGQLVLGVIEVLSIQTRVKQGGNRADLQETRAERRRFGLLVVRWHGPRLVHFNTSEGEPATAGRYSSH